MMVACTDLNNLRFFFLVSLLFLGSGTVSQAASFDCREATTETEIAICNDPELGALDELLGILYQQSLRANDWDSETKESDQSLINSQIRWIDQRNTLCRGSTSCLYEIYTDRTTYLLEYNSRPQFSWDSFEEEYRRLTECCAKLDKYNKEEIFELLEFLPFLNQNTDIRYFSTSFNVFWREEKVRTLSFLFISHDDPDLIYFYSKGMFNDNPTKLLISIEDRNGERSYSDIFEMQPLPFDTEISIWDNGFKIHTFFSNGKRSDTYQLLNLNHYPKLVETEGY